MSQQRELVQSLLDRWDGGEIEKYEFYAATAEINIHLVAQVTGIKRSVIYDRRRYLRQLAAMGQES